MINKKEIVFGNRRELLEWMVYKKIRFIRSKYNQFFYFNDEVYIAYNPFWSISKWAIRPLNAKEKYAFDCQFKAQELKDLESKVAPKGFKNIGEDD